MNLVTPVPPPYDPLEWERRPFPEKSRMVCRAWAMQGYGTPIGVYIVYALKLVLYVAGWALFCRFTPGMGGVSDFGSWWLRPEAFEKAILWSMLFEGLGLGCGSGPLTARYLPPLGGALYFLRPGTTKLPVFAGAPLIGAMRRGVLNVGLYLANAVLIVVALVEAEPSRGVLIAIAVLVPVLGVLDRTLFLSARGEHYWTTVAVFALTADWIGGARLVQAALWFWSGFSKLNHHFPAVIGVMTSNNPFIRLAGVRRLLYRRYPDDLSPSRIARLMGHAGTLLEFAVPIVLLSGRGGAVTVVGLVLMLVLHSFITSNVPMGVPIEWNLMVVYGSFFLFWKHADAGLSGVGVAVALLVGVMCLGVPLLGNLVPSWVPFLMAMRYYAGNWAYSVWLFRGESHRRLERLTKSSGWIYEQLEHFYSHSAAVGVVGKVMAFRLMHLHGRALPEILPRAVDDLDAYTWIDGELIAGMVLGWNFGEGHLHREQLLRAVQAQCGFEPGELRCIMVESQPLQRQSLRYRVVDACTGVVTTGSADVAALRGRQPWAWVEGG